ncbi:uncharacterized protein LOC125028946 [Penaeus chinensis]|uniref:uncharacterized protein LOC125028946 n=1 Tax=Penaeus chinensis TaxID=139456 RepID=UPI001FB5C4F5|nr:uncharacterized protein LOC125028946 [Penaeus chinensis]
MLINAENGTQHQKPAECLWREDFAGVKSSTLIRFLSEMKDVGRRRSSEILFRNPHVTGSVVGTTKGTATRSLLLLLALLMPPSVLLTYGSEDSRKPAPFGSRSPRGFEESGERDKKGQRGEESRQSGGETRGVSEGTRQASATVMNARKDFYEILHNLHNHREGSHYDYIDEYSGDYGNDYDYYSNNSSDYIDEYSGDYVNDYDYYSNNSSDYIDEYSGDYVNDYDYYSNNNSDYNDEYSGDYGNDYDYYLNNNSDYKYTFYVRNDSNASFDYGNYSMFFDGASMNSNEYDSLLLIYSRIIYFCEYVFSAMHGHYDKLPTTWVKHNNASLHLVSEPRFVAVCEPIFRKYDDCEAKFPVTVCKAENLAFLHPNSCKKPSLEDVHFEKLLVIMRLEQNGPCFHAVCKGLLRVIDRVINGVLVRLISPDADGKTCHRYIQEFFLTPRGKHFAFRARNFQWPYCFSGYHVLWEEDPRPRGLVPLWDSLSVQCRAVEVGLSLLNLLNVCFGVTGNILVIVVRGTNFSRWKHQDTLKVSLALCDLLLCLFVILPSIGVHFDLSTGRLEVPATQETSNVVINGGFRLFSAVIASTCYIVSIFQRFAFSVWILLRTKARPDFFRVQWLRAFPVVSWTVSLMTTLLLMHDGSGSTGIWASFSKLPFGLSKLSLSISFPIVTAVLALMILLTLLNYSAVLWNNLATAARPGHTERAEGIDGLTNLDMADISRRRHRLVLLIIQVLVNFVTSFMVGLALILNFRGERAHFISYIAWWLYLSLPSWNPWLYNLCSKRFRQDAADVLRKIFAQLVSRGHRRKALGVVEFRRNLDRKDGAVRFEWRPRLRQEAK